MRAVLEVHPYAASRFFSLLISAGSIFSLCLMVMAVISAFSAWSAPLFVHSASDSVFVALISARVAVLLVILPCRVLIVRQLRAAYHTRPPARAIALLKDLLVSPAWMINDKASKATYFWLFFVPATYLSPFCDDSPLARSMWRLFMIHMAIITVHLIVCFVWFYRLHFDALREAAEGGGGSSLSGRGLNEQEISEFTQLVDFAELTGTQQHHHVDASCSICWNDFEPTCSVRLLPCKHGYHAPCVDEWFTRNNSCPLCQKSVDKTM